MLVISIMKLNVQIYKDLFHTYLAFSLTFETFSLRNSCYYWYDKIFFYLSYPHIFSQFLKLWQNFKMTLFIMLTYNIILILLKQKEKKKEDCSKLKEIRRSRCLSAFLKLGLVKRPFRFKDRNINWWENRRRGSLFRGPIPQPGIVVIFI